MLGPLRHSTFNIQHSKFSCVSLLLAGLWSSSAPALDVGPPVYRDDVDARVTVDVVYERLKRDIEQDIAFSDGTFFAEQEENRIVSRLFFYPAARVTMQVGVGFTDSDNSVDFAPMISAGMQTQLARFGPMVLNGFLGGYYVDEIEYQTPGQLTFGGEFPGAQRFEKYYEVGGALTLSSNYDINSVVRLIPYAGFVASRMEAEGKETFSIVTTGETQTDTSVDFKDDSPVSAAVGIVLQVRRNFGLRFEGRLIGQSSYSAGVFFSF